MNNKHAFALLALIVCLFNTDISFAGNWCSSKVYKTNSPFKGGNKAGQPTDPNIKYFGRWDLSNTSEYVSHWGGAYLKVKFTGTTVKVKIGNKSNYYIKIDDGPWVSFLNASELIDATPVPLTAGTHTLSVAQGKDYNYVFSFKGLVLDAGAKTSKPDVGNTLIEYIGYSITAGYTDPQADVSDYAWVSAENLRCEHTQIAYPGITLVNGATNVGMIDQYFKQGSTAYPTSPEWNFDTYHPQIVVINLGTNDTNHKIADSLFQEVYTKFLTGIRAKFPKAEIFAMKTFSGTKGGATSGAVNALSEIGDSHVHYIDTTGWLTRGTDDYTDNTHPSVSGHNKVSKLLEPVLAPYINKN